jgi:hypothetical protein
MLMNGVVGENDEEDSISIVDENGEGVFCYK